MRNNILVHSGAITEHHGLGGLNIDIYFSQFWRQSPRSSASGSVLGKGLLPGPLLILVERECILVSLPLLRRTLIPSQVLLLHDLMET